MRSGSAICSGSRVGAFIALASADRDDDFERITVGKPRNRVAAARHDLAVSFDGHAFSGELERVKELRDIRARLETPRLTVYGKLNHVETLRRTGRIILPRGYRSKVRWTSLRIDDHADCHAFPQFCRSQETALRRELRFRPAARPLEQNRIRRRRVRSDDLPVRLGESRGGPPAGRQTRMEEQMVAQRKPGAGRPDCP